MELELNKVEDVCNILRYHGTCEVTVTDQRFISYVRRTIVTFRFVCTFTSVGNEMFMIDGEAAVRFSIDTKCSVPF